MVSEINFELLSVEAYRKNKKLSEGIPSDQGDRGGRDEQYFCQGTIDYLLSIDIIDKQQKSGNYRVHKETGNFHYFARPRKDFEKEYKLLFSKSLDKLIQINEYELYIAHKSIADEGGQQTNAAAELFDLCLLVKQNHEILVQNNNVVVCWFDESGMSIRDKESFDRFLNLSNVWVCRNYREFINKCIALKGNSGQEN